MKLKHAIVFLACAAKWSNNQFQNPEKLSNSGLIFDLPNLLEKKHRHLAILSEPDNLVIIDIWGFWTRGGTSSNRIFCANYMLTIQGFQTVSHMFLTFQRSYIYWLYISALLNGDQFSVQLVTQEMNNGIMVFPSPSLALSFLVIFFGQSEYCV